MAPNDDDLILTVLSAHYVRVTGLTSSTPDRCACGAETLPSDSDDYVDVRRARAFAAHQAAMITDARSHR